VRVVIHMDWPVKAWCIPTEQVDALRRRFPDVEFVHAATKDAAAVALRDADVAFCPFLTADWVNAAPNLRWVHSSAAAVEGLLPLPLLHRRDIPVTNSRGIQAVAMAENVIGGLLVLVRKFNRMLEAQREHKWIQNDIVHDWPGLLHGKRMTIVGLGTIGIEVARRAHAFGMKVTGIRRRVDQPRPEFVDDVRSPSQLASILPDTDVLVLSAPGVASTKGMIGRAQIAMLPRGALVANVARAQVIDEQAMIEALRSGALGGAVLDVFEKEPLDPASPLWDLPNVVITPHSSGLRAEHWDEVVKMFAENLERFRRGAALVNLVDSAAGY
jgi:phosphoglycerate dehydrogenase-like enzyme